MLVKQTINFLFAGLLVVVSSCGLSSQADQLAALRNCTYTIASADSVYLAGTDISRLVGRNGFNLSEAPSLVFGLMQQKIPLKGNLRMKIQNPGSSEAGINQFEYKILIADTELTSGYYNQKVSIAADGGITVIPIRIDSDLYPILSDAENQKAISEFFSKGSERKAMVTMKIKPSFMVGNEKINYPGYIDIKKEISSKELQSFIEKK